MKKPQKLLRDIFGFDEFRLGQREIIDAVSSKKNVLDLSVAFRMKKTSKVNSLLEITFPRRTN